MPDYDRITRRHIFLQKDAGHLVFDIFLDRAFQRPCTELDIIAFRGCLLYTSDAPTNSRV